MHMATIEVARHKLKLEKANTTEIDEKTPHPVINIMPEQEKLLIGREYGGTMRLGSYPCKVRAGTLSRKAYGQEVVHERHRHRYEFNSRYRDKFENAGLTVAGTSLNGKLVEMVELEDHPFFVGTQFNPEFKSRPLQPHPLFAALIKAAKN